MECNCPVGATRVNTAVSCGWRGSTWAGFVYRDKPAIFEVGRSPLRERPNSPAIVLKKRLHTVIRQSTIGHLAHLRFSFLLGVAAPRGCGPMTVNRDLAVIPSVQTVGSAKPNTAVPGP